MNLNEAQVMFGIDANLEPKELKSAYRKLAIQHHPDRGGNTETMQKLNEAYELLLKHSVVKAQRFDWAAYRAQRAEIGERASSILMQILECVDLEGISERMSEIFDKAGNISISPAKTHDGTSTAFIRWKSEDQENSAKHCRRFVSPQIKRYQQRFSPG